MTNTYDTSNEPLGSTAVKVLYNNASNLDEAVNSDADTWVDRPPFGRVRRTWRGMENAFDAFLTGTAFELPPLIYVDGTPLQVDRATQLIERSGLLYSVKLPATFPITLSGTWATDEPLLTVRNDQSLRQDLAGTAKVGEGAAIVGDAAIMLGSISDLTQVSTPLSNRSYSCIGYRPGSTKGGGQFVWQAGASKTLHDGVAIIDPGRPFPTDFNNTGQVSSWFTAVAGTGVFVKVWSEVRGGYEAGMEDYTNTGDRLMLSALLNSLAAQGGRLAVLPRDVNRIFSETVEVPKGVALDLNGATIEFQITGSLHAFYLNSYSQIYNGSVSVNGTSPSGGGDKQAPVAGGNQTTGEGVIGVVVRDLSVSTTRPNGNGVVFFGECTKCEVSNIHAPSSSTIGRVVAFEWGGTVEGGTGHPHNCRISNISAGTMSYGSTTGDHAYIVWLSSTFNMTVENVYADSAYGVLGIFPGDRSRDYAPLRYRNLIGTGITADNISCLDVRFYGVRCSGRGSSSPTLLAQSAVITNAVIRGNGVRTTALGLVCEFTEDTRFVNPNVSRMQTGVVTGQDTRGMTILGGEIWENRTNGLFIGSAGGGVTRFSAEGVRIYANNQVSASGDGSAAGARVRNCSEWSIRNCWFGVGASAETQQYSVYIESTALNGNLEGNRTFSLVTGGGGIAYVNSTVTDYAVGTMGRDNIVLSTFLTPFAGAPLYTFTDTGLRKFTVPAAAAPTTGTWARGDTCEFALPSAGGHKGAVCVTAGTPGTWKTFGAISA